MYLARTPNLLKRSLKNAIWDIPTEEKIIYLTFDDGPTPDVTEHVLSLLDQFQAKATFFCIGNNVVEHNALYKRIQDKGHRVGNHTYDHLSGWESNEKNYVANVDKCAEVVDSKLFRPPYGRIGPRQYKSLKKRFDIVMWSILSWDFDPWISPEKCADNVINHAYPGAIVVFHDSIKAAKNCLFALEKVLIALSKEGYQFRTLPNKR